MSHEKRPKFLNKALKKRPERLYNVCEKRPECLNTALKNVLNAFTMSTKKSRIP